MRTAAEPSPCRASPTRRRKSTQGGGEGRQISMVRAAGRPTQRSGGSTRFRGRRHGVCPLPSVSELAVAAAAAGKPLPPQAWWFAVAGGHGAALTCPMRHYSSLSRPDHPRRLSRLSKRPSPLFTVALARRLPHKSPYQDRENSILFHR